MEVKFGTQPDEIRDISTFSKWKLICQLKATLFKIDNNSKLELL